MKGSNELVHLGRLAREDEDAFLKLKNVGACLLFFLYVIVFLQELLADARDIGISHALASIKSDFEPNI